MDYGESESLILYKELQADFKKTNTPFTIPEDGTYFLISTNGEIHCKDVIEKAKKAQNQAHRALPCA